VSLIFGTSSTDAFGFSSSTTDASALGDPDGDGDGEPDGDGVGVCAADDPWRPRMGSALASSAIVSADAIRG
jgi:hypothetical protein